MAKRRPAFQTACALLFSLAVALGVGLVAHPAAAHSLPPTVVTAIDAALPPLPLGARVGITSSVAEEIYLSNPSDRVVAVVAATGEEFLRVSRAGVEANLASPDWWTSNDPTGTATVPAAARPGASPRWVRVTDSSVWAWFDHRLHPASLAVPRAIEQGRRSALLARWQIPIRVAGADGSRKEIAEVVTGTVNYQPVLGGLIVRVTNVVPGLSVQVLQGRLPGISMTVQRPHSAVILGADRKPFARISSNGVRVWTASPTWIADRQARGQFALSQGPRWMSLGAQETLTWLEPRLIADPQPSAQALAARRAGSIYAWQIPVVVDSRAGVIGGEVDWVPADDSAIVPAKSNSPAVAVGLAVLAGALGVGAWTILRLRARRGI